MFFQKMSVPVQSTVTVSSFLGLDRRARGELGSFREMENLTSDGYPTLTVRPRRGLAGQAESPGGIAAKDALIWVDGHTLYVGGVATELVLTEGSKQLIGMGSWLIVWPDKKYINTGDLSQHGSLENRVRFARMLTRAIRKAVPGMIIDYKLSIVTPQRGKGGIDEADAVQFAQWLVEDGVDMFHVAQANHTGNMADTIPPMGVQPYGFFVRIAGDIKKAVNVPVSAVGRIVDAEMAERVIESGMADIVAMGRPLLADPDWGTKIAAGKACDIRRCISCNKGCTDAIQNRQFLSCVLNAENGYENSRSIQPAEQKKKIAVLGGGPAGLEAARVAALRGHDVTLFEKTTSLGGQLNIACVPPRKEEMRRATQDLIHAVCNAGVHLCMGQTRTAEQLKEAGFEAVINAVGAHSAAPRIPGIDGVNVADAWKVLAGEQQVYGTVAVIGGGMVGCETAEYLAARGCKVSVIEMMDKIAAGESTTILPTLLENYKTYGVEQYPSHKVKEFRMDAVVCENKDGAEVTIPCDYIVLAMGARSNEFDAAALEAANIPVYSIGDAAGKAADISNAIRTGYDTACQL